MTFGKKIVTGRKRKGYTQQQLAELAGISKRAVASYESDGRIPHQATVKKLADILGYTASYLKDDTADSFILPTQEQLYISGLRELYGEETASEVEELLQKSTVLFAGGSIDQDAKDQYFLALTNAYIACKKASGESGVSRSEENNAKNA